MFCRFYRRGENGYIAIITLMIVLLMVGTALAYLKWSSDESVEFKRQYAVLQAYYIAQSAISQDVIPCLMNIEGEPPIFISNDGSAEIISFDLPEGMKGKYRWDGRLSPENSSQSGYGSVYNGVTHFYNIEITGTVEYSAFNRFKSDKQIAVDTTLFLKFHSSNSWAQYLYFTNFETTVFNEKIKFQSGDTLWWDIHSNDQIAIMTSPVFYGDVFTTASNFWYGSSPSPQFYGDTVFNCDPIPFYETLQDLRDAALAQGHFYGQPGFQYRCVFQGGQGMKIYEWQLGLPFIQDQATIAYSGSANGGFFIDGRLEVTGVHDSNPIPMCMGYDGVLSVGCSDDMWLLDNIRNVDAEEVTGYLSDNSSSNILGLMSESNVLIANTAANGRDNGRYVYPGDQWHSDIIIDAGIVALGESFSFEDQNDIITAYGGRLPEWYYSAGPPDQDHDERGFIRLWGQVSQYRRGYVHRSNYGGTGYYKDYHYDMRFYSNPPPYYPRLADEVGSNVKIDAWGAGNIPGASE